jgi:heme exporter protein D
MNWNSMSDFLAMGGYAFYVWGSYIVTFGLMAAEIVLLAMRRRGVLRNLGTFIRAGQGANHETKA